ncbi:hypothetical protein LTR66_005670 [Elasticomyces elasticus]|nr:hypothetical protein LTR66_005670 [Elasticomyces elasticus]
MANVFGALNRFISRLDADPSSQKSGTSGAYGFQVLRNTNLDLPLEPWFDFIIGINGRTIDNSEPALFATEIHNCAGSTVSLGIHSAKGQQIREVYVPIPSDPPKLGLSLQWTPINTTEDVWHILEIQPNSPADTAGLLPYSDYVIGSPEGLVRSESGLGELIEDFLSRPLRLYVYNHEYDVTRTVTINPSRGWGGEGALGCLLGFGALHRVPAPLTEPTQAPGETLFDTSHARFSNEEARPASALSANNVSHLSGSPQPPQQSSFFIPANVQFSATSPPPIAGGGAGPPKGGRKARALHTISPGMGMDEYFKEGEQKSREHDNAPTPKPGSALPPPPRAGTQQPPSQSELANDKS